MWKKEIPQVLDLYCNECEEKEEMYLVDYSDFWWWRKYQCNQCGEIKVLK
jgi:hypothetical protein